MKQAFIFSLFLMFVSCAPQYLESESFVESIPTREIETQDSILFLGFDIFKAAIKETDSVQLNTKMITAGFLKKDISAVPTIPEGKIKCSLLNANKKVIKSTLVDNPLIQSLEYGEHDGHDHSGHDHDEKVKLAREVVKKEQAYFSFRSRYDATIKFVRIELVGTNANPSDVFLISLSEK